MTTTFGQGETWQRKVLAILVTFALFASLVTVFAPRADAEDADYYPGDSQYNSTDFWESYLNDHDGVDNSVCEKDEVESASNYVADADYRLVIVKKGSGAEANRLHWNVESGDVLPPGPSQGSGQGFSHLIVCTNTPNQTTTTTEATTTTTTEATTTTTSPLNPSAAIKGEASCRMPDGSFSVEWTFTLKQTNGMTAVVYNNGEPTIAGFDVIGGPPTIGPAGNLFLGSYPGDGTHNETTFYGPDDEPTFPIRATGTVDWDNGTYVQENVTASHINAPDNCFSELADPTWTVVGESLVCNPETGEYEAQSDGYITLHSFDNGAWVDSSLTNLSAGIYGPFGAQADAGYIFTSTGTDQFSTGSVEVGSTGGSEPCDELVTAVAPDVSQSEACEVEGSYTIPATEGVTYLLDGEVIAAGEYSGPVSGVLTAVADEGFELTNPEFSIELEVAAAAPCAEIVITKVVLDGSDTETSFTFVADFALSDDTLADGESASSGDLEAGTYAVSETVPEGWELVSAVCDDESDPAAISLQAGEKVTCTFTNGEVEVASETTTDVAVTKIDLVDPVRVDTDNPTAHITYEITVTNNGPELAEGVSLTDTLPASLTYVSATAEVGTCSHSAGVVTCDLGDLAAGDTVVVTVVVETEEVGEVSETSPRNVVVVSSDTEDSNPSNNTDDEVTDIIEVLDTVVLPFTGINSEEVFFGALLLLALGLIVVGFARREDEGRHLG